MGQSLLNGSDASGVAAFDDVFDLFGKYQYLLLYDLTIFDDIDGDVVVDECQYIQIQHIDVTFYFQNVFFAHFSAAGVFDDGYLAFQLVQAQVIVDVQALTYPAEGAHRLRDFFRL